MRIPNQSLGKSIDGTVCFSVAPRRAVSPSRWNWLHVAPELFEISKILIDTRPNCHFLCETGDYWCLMKCIWDRAE